MSLHDDAVAVLAAWSAPSAEQALLREEYLGLLDERPDALTRGCRPDHLTASVVVLCADFTHVALTLHAKARRWFQFGGHCEPEDETLAAAARREAGEESGVTTLSLDPVPLHLGRHDVPFCGPAGSGVTTRHFDVRFVAVAPPGARLTTSEESLDVRWWPTDELPDPDLLELVERAARRCDPRRHSSGGDATALAADHPRRNPLAFSAWG